MARGARRKPQKEHEWGVTSYRSLGSDIEPGTHQPVDARAIDPNFWITAPAARMETGEESDVPALAAALFRDFFEPDLFDEEVPAGGTTSRFLNYLGADR